MGESISLEEFLKDSEKSPEPKRSSNEEWKHFLSQPFNRNEFLAVLAHPEDFKGGQDYLETQVLKLLTGKYPVESRAKIIKLIIDSGNEQLINSVLKLTGQKDTPVPPAPPEEPFVDDLPTKPLIGHA